MLCTMQYAKQSQLFGFVVYVCKILNIFNIGIDFENSLTAVACDFFIYNEKKARIEPMNATVRAHPQNVQLLNVQLLNVQLPNVQLPKVLITKRPDYQTSSYQRSRLPNVQFTKRPVTKHPVNSSYRTSILVIITKHPFF